MRKNGRTRKVECCIPIFLEHGRVAISTCSIWHLRRREFSHLRRRYAVFCYEVNSHSPIATRRNYSVFSSSLDVAMCQLVSSAAWGVSCGDFRPHSVVSMSISSARYGSSLSALFGLVPCS